MCLDYFDHRGSLLSCPSLQSSSEIINMRVYHITKRSTRLLIITFNTYYIDLSVLIGLVPYHFLVMKSVFMGKRFNVLCFIASFYCGVHISRLRSGAWSL